MPQRFDTSTVDLGKLQRTPQGGVRIPAFPTRVGVFPYQVDGQTRLEYRPPEEVFHADSLASLHNAPVTDLHPEAGGVRIPVTPDNFRALSVGHAGTNARPEGDHVAVDLIVQDGQMIRQVEAGQRRELSCGYGCDLDQTPGTAPNGEKYDAVQRNIRYNHVAMGPANWGRQGSSVALRLDSGDGEQISNEGTNVENEIIDGKSYKVGSADWATAKNAQLAAMTAQRDQALGRADAAQATIITLQADADPKKRNEAIQRRAKLLTDCAHVARKFKLSFDAAEAAAAPEGDLISNAIKVLAPTLNVAGKSPEYLAGVFETLIAQMVAEESKEPAAAVDAAPPAPGATPPVAPMVKSDSKGTIFGALAGTPPTDTKTDSNAPDPDKARQDSINQGREAWKQPLAGTRRARV